MDQLKDAIKEKKKQTLANVKADTLILYRVTIDPTLDNDQQETTLTQLSENLGEHNKLINTSYLSAIFDIAPPDRKTWLTLVQFPQGESIYCGGIVLMADVVNTDTTCNNLLIIHYHPIYHYELMTCMSVLSNLSTDLPDQ